MNYVIPSYRFGVSSAALAAAGVVAADVGGAALITGEGTGMGIDFTYHTDQTKQVEIRGTGAYSGTAYGKLTYTSPSIKLCRQSDGVWRYNNHNTYIRSEEADNGSVTKDNVTVSANSTAAPDGTSITADTIIASATTSEHRIYIDCSATGGLSTSHPVVLSVFAKAGTASFIAIGGGTASLAATFQLAGAGTISNVGGSVTSTNVTSVGSGWYRCEVVLPTGQFHVVNMGTTAGNATSQATWLGAGETVFVWGMQAKRHPVNDARGYTYATGYMATSNNTPYDLPFEWDISGNSLGILVEEQRANSALYSQDFSNAAWVKDVVTITADNTTAPDGTSTADRVNITAGSGAHRIYQDVQGGGSAKTMSIFVKAGSGVTHIGMSGSSSADGAVLQLSDGTVSNLGAQVPTASAVDAGNGWWRFIVYNTQVADYLILRAGNSAANAVEGASWSAAGTETIYIWGGQAELNSTFATSPIHTVAASVTRVPDNIKIPTASYPSQAQPMSYYFKGQIDVATAMGAGNVLLHNDVGGGIEMYTFAAADVSGIWSAESALSSQGGSWLTGQRKVAMRVANNDLAICKDGDATPGTDTSWLSGNITLPGVNLYFGGRANQTLMWNGHIQEVAVFPRSLSDAELISKTNDGPGASDLLLNENDGLSFDFTYATVSRQARIKDNTTQANNYHGTPRAKLTYTSPSAKLTRQSDGVWRYNNHNLVSWSETIDSSTWPSLDHSGSVFPTFKANAASGPAGASTADEVAFGACSAASDFSKFAQQYTTFTANTYNFSAWFKAKAAGDIGKTLTVYIIDGASNLIAGHAVLTGAWQRISVSTLVAAGSGAVSIGHLGSTYGGVNEGAVTAYVWGAQLKRTPVQDALGFTASTGYLATTTTAVYDLPYEWSAAGVPQGILIEEARTNAAVRSQEAGDAVWTVSAVTVATNSTVAPDGTTTADTLTPTTANAIHRWHNASGMIGGTLAAMSVFVKPNGYTQVALREELTTGAAAIFNLTSSGAVVGVHNAGGLTVTASIQAEANGWYRIVAVFSGSSTSMTGGISFTNQSWASGDPLVAWVPNGTSGIYVWGFQAEVGAFPTSPIHTVAGTVARAVDNISLLTSAMPVAASTGSMIAYFNPKAVLNTAGTNQYAVSRYNSSGPQDFVVLQIDNTGVLNVLSQTGGSSSYTANHGSAVAGTDYKFGISFQVTDFASTVNGASPTLQASGSAPSAATTFSIGNRPSDTARAFNGYIKQITYIKTAISDANLQTRTT